MSPPYIPATALGGDLVRDWTGPADGQRAERWLSGILVGQASDGRLLWTPARGIVVPDALRLDPRCHEVAHRVADVLRARGHEVGHLLPVALGGRQGDVTAYEPCANCFGGGVRVGLLSPHPMEGAPCANCAGTGAGTIRRTIPAADVSALTLAASVAGVEAGRGVVRGVFLDWKDPERATIKPSQWPSSDYASRYCLSSDLRAEVGSLIHGRHDYRPGWWIRENDLGRRGPVLASGPETGPEGRAAADAALLRLGYARLNPTAPFGVVAPFLRDGREVGS